MFAAQLEAHRRGEQAEDHTRLHLHDVTPAQEHGAPRLVRAADRILGVTPRLLLAAARQDELRIDALRRHLPHGQNMG